MKKVCVVIGTRPEAIKMAPVYLALKQIPGLKVTLVSSGQHQELLYQALDSFGLKPDIDLQVMSPGQSLSSLNARMLVKFEECFQKLQPSLVLGHGDTSTCFAAALSSFYQQIPFLHVEAGLRTHKLNSPFPEEFNRQAVAKIATFHFAPSERERQHLLHEGISSSKISVIGNTIHDSISHFKTQIAENSPSESRPVVSTLHRRENGSGHLEEILETLRALALDFPKIPFILPMHPNPKVQNLAQIFLSPVENFKLCHPIAYPQFLSLLARSRLVLTDSGGVQEEATFLQRPVFLLRKESERQDGLGDGLAKIIGTQREGIFEAVSGALRSGSEGLTSAPTALPGASKEIARHVSFRLAS